jgi:hypothetical protein
LRKKEAMKRKRHLIICPVLRLKGMAMCAKNGPHAHALLIHHSLSDSLERKARKERLAIVAAKAAIVIG